MIKRDVIIVGAGISGSVCAAYLAKRGVDVLLLEKEAFPRDKACGDLLREGIVTHLSKLDLFDKVDEIGTLIRRLHIISPNGSECVLPYEAYAVPRYQIDDLLVQAAIKRGAEFRDNCKVKSLIVEDGNVAGVHVRERGVEFDLYSKLVILADGVGALAPKEEKAKSSKFISSGHYVGERAYFAGINLEEALSKGQYDSYGVFGFHKNLVGGYYWIMPSGTNGTTDGYCNVGIIRDSNVSPDVNADDIFADLIKSNKRIASLFINAEKVSPWKTATINDIANEAHYAGNGYLVIGNARSIMMPLLKDGTSAAADMGEVAAYVAKEAIDAEDVTKASLEQAIGSKLDIDDERLRFEKLTNETLYDSPTIDRMIGRIVNNPSHSKKVIGEIFG